jgi:hypothetical protein
MPHDGAMTSSLGRAWRVGEHDMSGRRGRSESPANRSAERGSARGRSGKPRCANARAVLTGCAARDSRRMRGERFERDPRGIRMRRALATLSVRVALAGEPACRADALGAHRMTPSRIRRRIAGADFLLARRPGGECTRQRLRRPRGARRADEREHEQHERRWDAHHRSALDAGPAMHGSHTSITRFEHGRFRKRAVARATTSRKNHGSR